MRQHLQSVYAQTGVLPSELENEPEIPEPLEYLWDWFMEVGAARTSNGFGINPLSYQEILSWCILNQRQLEPWEVKTIKELDLVYIKNAMSLDNKE